MIEINGKKYRNIQEQVEKNKEDIKELQEGGFVGYTAGNGIDIDEDIISIDDTVVATKTDLEDYELKSEAFSGSYNDLTDKPTIPVVNNGILTIQRNGSAICAFTANQSIHATADINVPTKTTDLLNDSGFITSYDIPTYTGGDGITINSGNVVSADSTIARVADIPSITGLVMYNYKITISGLDSGTSTARSAVYIISLPYQWDYSSLTKYDIIRLIPVWSVVADTDVTSTRKIMGIFHWQTGTIAQVDWVDETFTYFDFVGGFDATIEAAAPAHW